MSFVSVSTVIRTFDGLMPEFCARLKKALARTNSSGYSVSAFETIRIPERQDYLYAQGRTRAGRVITRAKAWQSWHQYAAAADIAVQVNGKWSWEFDPDRIAPFFLAEGLESLAPFESCHFQLTGGLSTAAAYALHQSHGLHAVWDEITRRLAVKGGHSQL